MARTRVRRRRRVSRRADNPRARRRTAPRRRRRAANNARGWFRTRGRRYGRRGIKRRIRGRRRYTRPTRRTYRRRVGIADNPPRRRRRRSRRRLAANNPPRRRRRRMSSRRRRASNNPRHYGRRRIRLLDNPIDAIMSTLKEAFSMDSVETVFHAGLGFGGALAGSRLVYRKLLPGLDTPVGRVGTHVGVSILETVLGGLVGGHNFATRVLTGGLLATLWQGLTEVLPSEAKEFIPTLGEGPESAEFRKAIETEVLRELRGGGSNGGGMSVYLQPAGVQETYLQPAGSQTYLTAREGERLERSGVSTYLTERELVRAESGIGDTDMEFGGRGLPERF